jgi:resuscitation-promoting factor RpfA
MSERPGAATERDAKLDALYRAAPRDEPPAALDEAILAASRRAVAAQPRLAGSLFSRSWRVPMSIAAVIVLSVSLVSIMRENAPDGVTPPPQSASGGPSAETSAARTPAVPGISMADEKAASGLGLRPSSSSGMGLRHDTESGAAVGRSTTPATRADSNARDALPGPSRAEPFPSATGGREARTAAEPAPPQQMAKVDTPATPGADAMRRDPGPDSQSERLAESAAPAKGAAVGAAHRALAEAAPASVPPTAKLSATPRARAMPSEAPAAAIAGDAQALSAAGLPPEKWLEQIEALRKQGRVAEAKASLQEFRKRYPGHSLPAALKDWAGHEPNR